MLLYLKIIILIDKIMYSLQYQKGRIRTLSSRYNFDHYFLLKYVYKN
jgi:hypothetical protein